MNYYYKYTTSFEFLDVPNNKLVRPYGRIKEKFELDGKVVIITGGAGILGHKHAEVVAEFGGIPVLLDVNISKAKSIADEINKDFKVKTLAIQTDITSESEVKKSLKLIIKIFGRVDVLINNASNNPHYDSREDGLLFSRFENYPIEQWNKDINVGLTGVFICSKIFGHYLSQNSGGVILNISSDLGIIAPDNRIYEKEGLKDHEQPVKAISYSAIKSGILGLTRYMSVYWAKNNIRVNAICPAGVYTDQDESFVSKLTNLIPMGRMANMDEYKAAIIFLISDASSYMTGATLVIDGGRTII